MNKHTIDLKETIEYKKYFSALLLITIVAIIYGLVIMSVCIWFASSMPFEHSIAFIFATALVCSPFIFVLAHYIIKFSKKIANMKKSYNNYIELVINLGSPIEVGFNKIKYSIKITLNDNEHYEIVTDAYSKSNIQGNKMLIGFNEKDKGIIFMKNI